MKCENMHPKLISLLFGETDPDEKEKIENHIRSCKACKKIFEELQGTTHVLNKWEDENPHLNLVFMKDRSSPFQNFINFLKSMNPKKVFLLGVPAAFVTALLILSLINFRISHKAGEWHASFSLIPQTQTTLGTEEVDKLLAKTQKETLLMVADMVEASESRQNGQIALTMNRLSQSIEKQRKQDLRIVGEGIEGLQRTTDGRYYQTSAALKNIMQLTGYSMSRK